ncbi:MAG: recombination-associated protein RdgC [Verrucomicrobiaceae bacterium]|nr:recombination-associated protein RdgC [Verrucomicrobiaceae bacterium]
MWFKNLLIYRFTAPFQINDEEFEQKLTATPFVPCGSQDLAKAGWVAPMPNGELLSHTANACTLLSLRKQQKILPGAAVAEALEEKINAIQTAEARKVYSKERKQLKEEILISLAPRALTRSSRVFAYIDVQNQWLIVNGSSRNSAEELLTQLRNDIGSLPLVPIETKSQPITLLTEWLRSGELPEGFTLGEQCEFRDVQETTNTVKVRGQDLRSEEVLQHIEAGKQVTKLELHWREAIDFIIGDDLIIRRVRFRDELLEQIDNLDDAAAQFDQEFGFMTMELAKFIAEVIGALGGAAD